MNSQAASKKAIENLERDIRALIARADSLALPDVAAYLSTAHDCILKRVDNSL